MNRAAILVSTMAVVTTVVSCRGGDGNRAAADVSPELPEASGPNVDPSKLVVATSMSERNSLCDWIAQEFGGYGHVLRCDADVEAGEGILVAPENPQACTSIIGFAQWPPSCPLSVAQFTSCIEWETQNVCIVGVVTRAMLPADCQTFLGSECVGGVELVDSGAD
jgi:hypothetical protein